LPKSQVWSSEWKTEWVREDANDDSEDGEEDDDELPCVIGESEGDCIWQLYNLTLDIQELCWFVQLYYETDLAVNYTYMQFYE